MSPIDLNPIHYILAGALVICIALGIYNRILSAELKTCEQTIKVTEVIGNVQDTETERKDKSSKENKRHIDEKTNTNLSIIESNNKRLRHEITNSRKLPTTSQVCTGSGTTTKIDWPFIDSAIRTFSEEVAEIVTAGDKDRVELDSIKEWVEKEID